MENNQTNTMNLGGNVAGAMPPVFGSANVPQQQPSTAEQIKLDHQNTVTSRYVQVVQQPAYGDLTEEELNAGITQTQTTINQTTTLGSSVQSDITNVATVVATAEAQDTVPPTETATEIKEPVVITGDIVVPTILLREMVAQARKVGVANNMQPLSEVLNLIIDENGITMRTTSGRGKQDFECVDKRYVFKSKLSVSLDIRMFGEYLNAERNSTLTLKFVEAENTLYITTDTGMRKFAQRVDGSTHQPVENVLHFPVAYEDMINIDYARLKKLLDLTSSARDLATKSMYEYLKGMYCGDDIIVSSDGNIMIIQANDTEFKDKIFFLNNDLCSLILGINFNPTTFRIGITEANGAPAGMTISDGRTTICGPLSIEESFPVQPAKNFWNSKGFVQQVSIETRAFLDILKSVIPFVPTMGDDLDKVAISINGNEMEIKCLDGTAREVLDVINTSNFVTSKPISLPISKLEKLVGTIISDNFDFMVDIQADNCICLSYDGLRSIVTTLN